jgi:hypothetical protein
MECGWQGVQTPIASGSFTRAGDHVMLLVSCRRGDGRNQEVAGIGETAWPNR